VDVYADSVTIDIGEVAVEPSAALQFTVDVTLPGEIEFYVSLKGTRLIIQGTQNNLALVMDDVPAGVSHTVHVRVVKPVQTEVSIGPISVVAGIMTVVDKITIQ